MQRHPLLCPFCASLSPWLSSCSPCGRRSSAEDALAETVHQMGGGCFLIIPSTSASSRMRSRGVCPSDNLGYSLSWSWAFQRDASSYHSALGGDLLQPHQHVEIGFLLKQEKDNPNPNSHFSIPLLLYIALETFAKPVMATNPRPFPMDSVNPKRVPVRKPGLEKMPY